MGGGAHRGVRRAAGEEQLQEADEGVRAELAHHGPQHELPALPGGLGVDGAGQSVPPRPPTRTTPTSEQLACGVTSCVLT